MPALPGIRFGSIIATAAKAHGLDPTLLAAVAAQETGGPGSNSGHNVVGDRGHGHGLFQIDDRSHPFASTPAAMDVAKNAEYAARMLQDNLRATKGNVKEALSMYNAGTAHATGTRTTWADGTTLGYADSVMRHAKQIGSMLTSQLRDARSDDATAIGGLAEAAARQLATAAPALGSAPASGTNQTQSIVTALQQALSGTPLDTASSSATAGASGGSSGDPGALQMPSPVTQTGFSYHSYESELSSGSGSAEDADKKLASFVDSGASVFDTSSHDDA